MLKAFRAKLGYCWAEYDHEYIRSTTASVKKSLLQLNTIDMVNDLCTLQKLSNDRCMKPAELPEEEDVRFPLRSSGASLAELAETIMSDESQLNTVRLLSCRY